METANSEAKTDEAPRILRVAIAGGPGAGKSTAAQRLEEDLGLPVLRTDDLKDTCEWSELSAVVSGWFDVHRSVIVEGVATPRALRKWLRRNEGRGTRPCEWAVWVRYGEGRGPSKKHASMAKGARTVWREILPELEKRGVRIMEVTL